MAALKFMIDDYLLTLTLRDRFGAGRGQVSAKQVR